MNNVIISSTLKPDDLQDMDPDIITFLDESEIFEMKIGDKNECIDLLYGIYKDGQLTQEAVQMLTDHFTEDVGQLLGAAQQYITILEKDNDKSENITENSVETKNKTEEESTKGESIESSNVEKVDPQTEQVEHNQEAAVGKNSQEVVPPDPMIESSTEKIEEDVVISEEVEEVVLTEEIQQNHDTGIENIAQEQTQPAPNNESSVDLVKDITAETEEVEEVEGIEEVVLIEDDQQPKSDASAIIASQFKKMLEEAKTENELSVVLKFAFEEKLGQLRNNGGDAFKEKRLEKALELLNDGNVKEAVQCAGS